MIEYSFITLIIVFLVIDNYRLRSQLSRDLEKQRIFNLEIARAAFYHTNNVLFEGDVVSMDELEYDGTQEELIHSVFDNLVAGVEVE